MAEQEQQSDAYYTDLLSRVDDCVAETREAGHTDNVGHVGGSGVQCIAPRTSTIAAEALLSVVLWVPSAAVRANLYISTCRVCVSTPRLGATHSHEHLAMSYMLSCSHDSVCQLLALALIPLLPSSFFLVRHTLPVLQLGRTRL